MELDLYNIPINDEKNNMNEPTNKNKKWSEEEDCFIKSNYSAMSVEEISVALNRTQYSIIKRATYLKCVNRPAKRWSKDETEYVYNNYSTKSAEEIAAKLNRTPMSVYHKAIILGITDVFEWSKEQEEFVILNFDSMRIIDMSKVLNLSYNCVKLKCKKLCLRKRHVWTDEERELVKNCENETELLSVATKLGVSFASVDKVRRNLGFKSCNIFMSYRSLVKRCTDPKNDDYANYGGRGIKVCDEWLLDDRKFVEWSLNNGWKKGLSIDRINNNGPYSPENCRWADQITQANNKRTNKKFEAFGETKTISEWSRDPRCKASRSCIATRIRSKTINMSPEDIIQTPKRW